MRVSEAEYDAAIFLRRAILTRKGNAFAVNGSIKNMTWGAIEEAEESASRHVFLTLKPKDMKRWLRAVAKEYVRLRTESVIPLPAMLDVSGIGVFDVSELKARLAKAVVPPDDKHRKQFSVTRADLSEVAAYMLLEKKFGTEIAFKLVRDRELISLPGRGIDAIGLEKKEKLLVVLSEVKCSDENSAPRAPQVVDMKNDGLRKQHLGHLKELNQTIAKIWDCARRAKDVELQEGLLTAAIYLAEGCSEEVEIVSSCILVRPESRYSSGDFGSFKKSPEDFSPAAVRFLIWALPGDLDSILADWAQEVEEQRQML